MLEEEFDVPEFRRVDSTALLQRDSSEGVLTAAVCSCGGCALCNLSISQEI